MASMAESTKGQYDYHLRKFKDFCLSKNHSDFTKINVNLGVEFLTDIYQSGKSYRTINVARSALSQFVSVSDSMYSFGNHPLVTRFMKGVYRLRTPTPKYDVTWDVSPLLSHLRSLSEDSLSSLTHKCVTLLAISTGQQMQTLAALDLAFMIRDDHSVTFTIAKPLKTSQAGSLNQVKLCKFEVDPVICPVVCLTNYLDKTSQLRNHNSLFVALCKPHGPVTAQTLSRWVSSTLHNAGIDTKFGAHSTRHASSSTAAARGVPVDVILKTVGWKHQQTFATFYRREVREDNSTFASSVLLHANAT